MHDHYHDFLATELERRLPEPTAERFPDADEYFKEWAYIQELVLAEIILGNARGTSAAWASTRQSARRLVTIDPRQATPA